MSGGQQSVVEDAEILGGRGRQLDVAREGRSQQQVEVKVTSDQGRPVKGPDGVVGWMKDHEMVSKKVSYKVDIVCCFISFLIAGVNFAAICLVFRFRTVSVLRGDTVRCDRRDRGRTGSREDIVAEQL